MVSRRSLFAGFTGRQAPYIEIQLHDVYLTP